MKSRYRDHGGAKPKKPSTTIASNRSRSPIRLGFDSVWAVEHHFLEEYSHCPAPELFLTACAMKTKKMRVGHGIVVCVPEFNHPIKIAERTAVLDILSGGRLDVGTGRSATWTELGRLSRQSRRDQEDLGRVRPLPAEDVDAGALLVPGPLVVDAAAHDRARSRTRNRIRRCGSRSPVPAPRSTPPSAAWAASV